jgi:hypothetical protein
MAVRIPRALLVLTAGLTVGLVGLATFARTPNVARPTPDPAPALAPGPPVVRSDGVLDVLHDWDVRRAAAWASGDAVALASLYTGSSRAGAADVALLRRYTARGLVVRGMRMQVLRARVLTHRPRLLVLEVTDRLAAAVAVRVTDAATARRLPGDAASTRVLVLRRPRSGPWVMARVSAAGGR